MRAPDAQIKYGVETETTASQYGRRSKKYGPALAAWTGDEKGQNNFSLMRRR